MAEDLVSEDDRTSEKTGLSPFNHVMVPDQTIRGAIEHLASAIGLTPTNADSEGWRAAARNTGSPDRTGTDSL